MTRATKPRHPLEWYRDPDGAGVDAQLHLLDRQMLDRDGVPVSTVDDVELAGVEVGEPVDHSTARPSSALLVGAAVLPRIFGGRHAAVPLGPHPAGTTSLASAPPSSCGVRGDDLDATWLERWFRRHDHRPHSRRSPCS